MDAPQVSMTLPETLTQMATGHWLAQSIYVAAKLGLADYLTDGPQAYQALATATTSHAPSLYRLLRALASVGIFVEQDPGEFALTPLAYYLRSDVPDSLRAMALMNGEEHYQAWGNLLHSIQTGESAFTSMYGMPVFQYLGQTPAAAAVFDQAMISYSSMEIPAVLDAYDMAGVTTVVDVAGGRGGFLAAILARYPQIQGILFDQPGVASGAQAYLAERGVHDRVQWVGGDFFEAVPTGGDIYLLKHILHDWGDADCGRILRTCHQAMAKTARLLVVEMVIPGGNAPHPGKFLDLNMLVMCDGGRERTAAEYRQLLETTGFQLGQILPTQAPVSVIEAVPV
nr:methyltransferase [Halomicronema hongdechloris]